MAKLRTTSASDRGRKLLLERAVEYFGFSSRTECVAAASLLGLMIGLKLVNMTRYKFDSDESQHLHVIWAWARGFVQYRDICDNHMPLFQIAFAPIFAVIGDRPTILYWMRFILLPMYFVTMWCTYRIATLLFSKRAGVWAAIGAGMYPGYHFCSFEFRTDNLWAPLWLLCLVVLLNGTITVRRALAAGLLLGLCFGISGKTTLLLVSILTSGALTLLLVGWRKAGLSRGYLMRCVAAFLATALLIPAIIAGVFALRGIWQQFRYWVVDNNILPGLLNHPAWWALIFPIAFPPVIFAAWIIARKAPDPPTAFRRGFVFLICGFYILALWSFWALVTRQDYLPYHPLAFVFYSAATLLVSNYFVGQRWPLGALFKQVPLPAFIAAGEIVAIIILHPFWIDGGKNETNLLRATLTLTSPGDYVLDEKGETVFRQRCFGPIWEPFVMERIRRGLMIDNAAKNCIEKRACVATNRKDMSSAATHFVEQNFLPVGNHHQELFIKDRQFVSWQGLWVAGGFLKRSEEDPKRFDFNVVIPAPYEIIAREGGVSGMLDGTPYTGARFLAPGKHSFVQTSNESTLAFLWAQAVDRHFLPVDHIDNPDH
jgi:hypothetical protein